VKLDIDLNIFLHGGQDNAIVAKLTELINWSKKMDQAIQDVLDQVAAVKGDVASTKAFIAAMEARITEILASENLKPETRDALATAFADLKGASQELKDAIDNDPTTP
jgi:uncharacterized protein YoxC